MILYMLGAGLVVLSVVLFFFAGGFDRWIPVSMLIAGVLLILGLAVMGFADSSPSDNPPVREVRRDTRDTTGRENKDEVTIINNRP